MADQRFQLKGVSGCREREEAKRRGARACRELRTYRESADMVSLKAGGFGRKGLLRGELARRTEAKLTKGREMGIDPDG